MFIRKRARAIIIIRCKLFMFLIFIKRCIFSTQKLNFSSKKFCGFGKSMYLCTR